MRFLRTIIALGNIVMLVSPAWPALDSLPDSVQQTSPSKNQTSQKSEKDETKNNSPQPNASAEDKRVVKEAAKASPSFQQKKWTGTQNAFESNIQFDYVGRAGANLGEGQNRNIDENYFDVRQEIMRHTLLAFLVDGGIEFQHMGFGVPNATLIPDRLDMLIADVGIDFRWSDKDLLHIEGRPGFYTDWRGSGTNAVNTPMDVGYTRVVNKRFQWVAGFSLNTWRASRFLGAAGFRWQMNDRWKLKFYLPQPDIEYLAKPNLTLTFGGDVRGDSYRVGPHFGDSRNAPALNSALVDYQEVRVGPGFSWNIRPLIELNFMAGYMIGRQFDFHNNGPKLNGSGAPFVSMALHALFKMPGESLVIPQRNEVSLQNILSFL